MVTTTQTAPAPDVAKLVASMNRTASARSAATGEVNIIRIACATNVVTGAVGMRLIAVVKRAVDSVRKVTWRRRSLANIESSQRIVGSRQQQVLCESARYHRPSAGIHLPD